MKARVFVKLKKSVLDPQGKTIQHSLSNLGYHDVQGVRQGKFFEIVLNADLSQDEARQQVESIAKKVLTNPVIEDFRYELDSSHD